MATETAPATPRTATPRRAAAHIQGTYEVGYFRRRSRALYSCSTQQRATGRLRYRNRSLAQAAVYRSFTVLVGVRFLLHSYSNHNSTFMACAPGISAHCTMLRVFLQLRVVRLLSDVKTSEDASANEDRSGQRSTRPVHKTTRGGAHKTEAPFREHKAVRSAALSRRSRFALLATRRLARQAQGGRLHRLPRDEASTLLVLLISGGGRRNRRRVRLARC